MHQPTGDHYQSFMVLPRPLPLQGLHPHSASTVYTRPYLLQPRLWNFSSTLPLHAFEPDAHILPAQFALEPETSKFLCHL
jgi:hypothetical protein